MAFLVVVILGAASGTCWAIFIRTVASPVSLRDALRIYRRDQAAAAKEPATARARPLSPGVFSYRTSGSESLSLLGAARSFPNSTDMVVSDGAHGCSDVEWVPIVQHTETTTVCPAPDHALTVSGFITHEEISDTTTTTVIDCPATTYLLPPSRAPGARWRATCHQTNPSEDVVVDGRMVGERPVVVGGQAVPAVHVRLTLQFAGVDEGTAPTDLWISTSKGLVVREQELATVTQQGVHYKEEMSTLLASVVPSG